MDWTLFLGLAIIAVCIVVGVIVYIKIKKKMSGDYIEKVDIDKIDVKSQLVKHMNFLWPKELEFYEMFRKNLPDDFFIFPKISVDKIVKPHGTLVMYNQIKNKYVDFCVFKRNTMEPICVIDCFYPSITDSTMKVLDKAVSKALEAVQIPVLQYEILDIPYDEDAVMKRFYNALDPVCLAQLGRKKEN